MSWIDWQAVAAVATVLVVLVALFPIFREARRRTAQARTLRIRLGSKLMILRPTLGSILLGPAHPSLQGAPILSPQQFQDLISDLDILMEQASVLHPEEQDQLGMTLYNLAGAARIYGVSAIPTSSAKNFLELIDRCIKLFEKHGLVSGEVKTPW